MKKLGFISKYLLIVLSVSLLASVGVQAYADNWVDGTPYLYEEGRRLAEILGHEDGAMLAPAIAAKVTAPAYDIGDEKIFYAFNMSTNKQYSISASLRLVSDMAYIFVEDGRAVANNKIDSLSSSFGDIYDKISGQFGPPPARVDGDPRIYLLIMDIADGAPADGSRIIGYFSPIDQYRNAQLIPFTDYRSNEVNMLYIDYISLNMESGGQSVIAHEFAHMVQWARDPLETVWVNEGLAVYTEGMLGYEVESRISAFEKAPQTPLINWSGTVADYGAAYTFFAYISEKYGGIPTIVSIFRNRGQGTEGIERSLAAQGKFVSFGKVFSDWVIANYLDNPGLGDGAYGYSNLDIDLGASVVEAQYPVINKKSTLKPWSALYIEFEKDQEDKLNLRVTDNDEDDIVAQIIEMGAEVNVSSLKTGNASSGETLISGENNKTIMVITSQPDPPETDKAYSSYTYSAEIEPVVAPVTAASDKKITTWGQIKTN